MARASPAGVVQETSVHSVLKQGFESWYEDLEQCPGPFGRVERSTTEALVAHLRRLAMRLESQDVLSISLESAARYPHSAALTCHFLSCLMESGGKRQSDDFWRAFAPALAKRAAALRPEGAASHLQELCARLASGDVFGALEEACAAGLWTHALILSRFASPEAYDRVLVSFGASLSEQKGAPQGSTEAELADPCVCALILLYEALGKGSAPNITDSVAASWPAYAAVFAAVLRSSEQHPLLERFLEALAGSLARQGDIFGAHLCLLMTGERSLESVDAPSSLICLLGVEHRTPKNFRSLLDPLALQLSEAFEYALRCGDADALCPTLQPFKLAHAVMLADVGLTEKARKYMTLLQAFVKAVPQNRLSDAFRSSMRELNEQLNPSLAAGPADAAPRVGKSLKDLFRGFAETTGLAVKATPPPALGMDDDAPEPPPTVQPPPQPGFAAFPPPASQPAAPLSAAAAGGGSAGPPMPPAGGGGAPPSLSVAPPLSAPPPLSVSPPLSAGPPMSSPPPASGPPLAPMQSPAAFPAQPPPPAAHPAMAPMQGSGGAWRPPASPTMPGVLGGAMGGGGAPGGEAGQEGEAPKPPERLTDSFEQDPLLNAGKAVWSGMKGFFKAVQGGADQKGGVPQERGPKDSQENTFYYDDEKKCWRQRGVENEPDISQYDPMTGKKLAPKVTEPPPPPPPMGGGPPMMGASASSGFGAMRHSGSLYVDTLASSANQPVGAPSPSGGAFGPPPAVGGGYGAPPGGFGAPPSTPGGFGAPPGPPGGGFGAPPGGFGAQPGGYPAPCGQAPGGGGPLATPFGMGGQAPQPPGVRASPFG